MNKNIKLAVAGAVLALSATANAGILIPAGDWTVDIGGNVNTYASASKADGTATIISSGVSNQNGQNTTLGFGNGLLPNFLSVGGTTRQNDLDVSFTISIQPGSSHVSALGVGADGGINNRQSFITFGDKSWGSVLVGKNIGLFAQDAILSDMTLLGVGAASAGSGNTSLGRIGYGYIYADWKPMIAYTTPNMSGFQATVGISQPFTSTTITSNQTAVAATDGALAVAAGAPISASTLSASPAYEGKASYSFAANDVTGKVWVSGIGQRVGSFTANGAGSNADTVAYAAAIGANISLAGFGLTGYYYGGSGIGTTGQMQDGYGISATAVAGPNARSMSARDSDGGYIQATFILPTKTKIGASWGVSNLDTASGETASLTANAGIGNVGLLQKSNEMWTLGAYHPLTKHLNLVAEYNYTKSENQGGQENKANNGSLGAILFF